jgi:hypothetical protein
MRNKEMLKKKLHSSGHTRSTDSFANQSPWHPHFGDGVVDISGPPIGTNGSNYGCNSSLIQHAALLFLFRHPTVNLTGLLHGS